MAMASSPFRRFPISLMLSKFNSQRLGFSDSAKSLAAKLLDSANVRSAGDVIVQNNADSSTGRAIIEEAKKRGLKTVNVLQDKPGTADIIESLKILGGDIVVTESYAQTWYMKRLLSDLPPPAAALNFSNGPSATAVAKLVGPGGAFLTYGSKLPTHVPYAGAHRRPKLWSDFLKEKKLKAETV